METGSKVSFTVYGEPQGKARARTVRNQYTGRTMSYTPDKTALYENLIRMEYQAQCGRKFFSADTPVELRIRACFGIPKSWPEKKKKAAEAGTVLPTVKKDADNIAKIIADGLNGIAWYDDKQVVYLEVTKQYDRNPRVEVQIRRRETEGANSPK